MMTDCRVFCLLMALLMALDSSSALIAPANDVNPICNTTTETLIAHPTKCAQYYNCSAPGVRLHSNVFEKNLEECEPPQLFNPDTQRCEHYSMVHCGNRFEPLGKCEYERYIGSSFGPPCDLFYPSCRNFSDGPHADKYKTNSPFYHVCVNQRLVYNGFCPHLATGPTVFNATLRICLSV